MRNREQMLMRKKATRFLSVALMVVGALMVVTSALSAKDPGPAFSMQLEVAALFFVVAGAFVGLSRIWGELAERTPPDSEKS